MKKASKGFKRSLIIGSIVAASVFAVTTQNTPEPVAIEVSYDYNSFEFRYALYNGLFDAITPSGDIRQDFSKFLFGQGGGKSKDPKDYAARYMPPKPDKDGEYYHTVHDITWKLFSSPILAAACNYDATPELFYEMPERIRNAIIDYHINLGSITDCVPVNLVLAYAVWGSGSYKHTLYTFEKTHGDINQCLKDKGEYFTFSRLLEARRESMRLRNQHQWHTYGVGWSSGIAHFHRVFKTYCKS